MVIEMVRPIFKYAEDENIFFERLYALPGYEKVLGRGQYLYLTVKASPTQVILVEIQQVCDIWNTTYRMG